ncbi:MAG TPA: ATP-binding cassette domain-containing protein [Chthoniobacterales bacterium]|jgi:molybdate transport system ATP-binding protein|nr:ATP-binding cassette domain-containing protein [Chthoniobacterales bacterium]
MSLQLREVRLKLPAFAVEIDSTFDRAIVGIFGPSGAGKTTLLELISGLRRPDAGRILLDDGTLFDASTAVNVRPRLRRIGYVPQDLALFPHLNVRANLIYGQRPAGENGLFTLEHAATVMEIERLLDRDVTTLSGGEQQRVAFARAILSAPRLLLLDEPMSSLDSRLKQRLVPFLLRIRDEFHIPLIYVTHDSRELSSLCDEVLLLHQGKIVGRGSPVELLGAET